MAVPLFAASRNRYRTLTLSYPWLVVMGNRRIVLPTIRSFHLDKLFEEKGGLHLNNYKEAIWHAFYTSTHP
jgi:hypothetical protein